MTELYKNNLEFQEIQKDPGSMEKIVHICTEFRCNTKNDSNAINMKFSIKTKHTFNISMINSIE